MAIQDDQTMRDLAQLLASMFRKTRAESGRDMALWTACTLGDISSIRAAIESGTDINGSLNLDGDTLLTKSIMSGQTHLACWLLDYGADPNVSLKNGRTPLITASGCGNIRVVEKLLQNGANVNTQMNNGATALMYAVSKRQLHVARMLVRAGASTTIRDNDGWTIVEYARNSGVNISTIL